MYRKILIKQSIRDAKTYRDKKELPGYPTNIYDKYGNEIITGDCVSIDGEKYSGPVFWNPEWKSFCMVYGCSYLGKDLMDHRCYGKAIPISSDNGMKNRIEIIPLEQSTDYVRISKMSAK